MKTHQGPTGDAVMCETCGQLIEPLRTSTTRYRHRKLLPVHCPTHPPRPAEPREQP